MPATLGLLIPPSIIMIVVRRGGGRRLPLFIGGRLPGILLASLFMGWVVVWSSDEPGRSPPPTFKTDPWASCAPEEPDPGDPLIGGVLGSIYSGIATATEALPRDRRDRQQPM